MLKRIFILLLPLFFLDAQAQQHTIRPGELWPDNHGVHINAHGGGILYHKGTYYWYGEHKAEHTSAALVGITCYSSKDLVNWTYRGVALPVDSQRGSDIERGCTIERPKVVYCPATKKFVLWFHLELKGRGYAAARAAVAIADKPTGPFTYLRSGRVNPYCYPANWTDTDRQRCDTLNAAHYSQWWTAPWRDAIRQGLFLKRDKDGGQMARDMTLFVDDDGRAYHLFSSEDNLTLHLAELSTDFTYHTGRYWRIAPGGQNEAPTLFKYHGRYWLITSGCTGWAPNEARMFSADSLTGEWTQWPSPCRGPQAKQTFGGQGTFVLPVAGRPEAFIFMADVWRPKHPIDARYVWLPITFRDGRPVVEWRDEWSPSTFWSH